MSGVDFKTLLESILVRVSLKREYFHSSRFTVGYTARHCTVSCVVQYVDFVAVCRPESGEFVEKWHDGCLDVVRPPRRVAGHGSHDAATLRPPFQLSFQIALAFAATNLFLLEKKHP